MSNLKKKLKDGHMNQMDKKKIRFNWYAEQMLSPKVIQFSFT